MAKTRLYHDMIDVLLEHSVNEVRIDDVKIGEQLLLDARESDEIAVSKIKGAIEIGYEFFDSLKLIDLPKEQEILVYCSVGYRSEKIAEKIIKMGFTNVSNMYGGIFEWVNNGRLVVDINGQPINQIHGYDSLWSIWVNDMEVVY